MAAQASWGLAMAKSTKRAPGATPSKPAAKRTRKPAAAKTAVSAPEPAPPPPPPPPAPPPPRRPLDLAKLALDRTAVLFIGLVVGAAIYGSFIVDRSARAVPVRGPIAQHAAKGAGGQSAVPAGIDCAVPFYPRLLKTVAKGDPITVGVFGDSFGEGIWAALYWTLPKSEHYQVIKFAERSTGFTRYQSLNLEDKAATDIAAQPVDIAVISFGANDTQGIYDDGHVYPLLSPGWKVAYGRRVARYIALLRAQGAMVYWVGLPKMRNPQFDSQIAAMNDFYSGEMAALDVPFLPTEALSVDDQGQFSIRLVDPKTKKDEIMRADDGIHMSIPGYERITGPLVQRIKTYVASSRDMAASVAPAGAGAQQVASASGRGT
jgi:uncharacterized protein